MSLTDAINLVVSREILLSLSTYESHPHVLQCQILKLNCLLPPHAQFFVAGKGPVKQAYRRRYESRRSSKSKLHKKQYGEKRLSIWRTELLHPAMWYDHDIDFARWLHPAMWHVALESWQWIHQVATPCNVIRDSGMTCYGIRPNVRHIGILHLVLILTISPQSTMSFCTSLQNFIQIGPPSAEKNDVMSIFKIEDSAILDFMGPIMGSLKSPCK